VTTDHWPWQQTELNSCAINQRPFSRCRHWLADLWSSAPAARQCDTVIGYGANCMRPRKTS